LSLAEKILGWHPQLAVEDGVMELMEPEGLETTGNHAA
jgi:hypothetical protein